eukprot:TRINITY_DN972_c0_g2_i1.p2 TRINITY_DN972_c0_g2~~TRINITY_DN972_c0_g2_i1.p2  ORF type:complete len:139 (-),score=11.60 TRINITY_DN972_c0_g2_i1:265-681(-)
MTLSRPAVATKDCDEEEEEEADVEDGVEVEKKGSACHLIHVIFPSGYTFARGQAPHSDLAVFAARYEFQSFWRRVKKDAANNGLVATEAMRAKPFRYIPDTNSVIGGCSCEKGTRLVKTHIQNWQVVTAPSSQFLSGR